MTPRPSTKPRKHHSAGLTGVCSKPNKPPPHTPQALPAINFEAQGGIFEPWRTNLSAQQCLALDTLPPGNWDYVLRVVNMDSVDITRSTGTLSIPAGITLQNVTPALTAYNNGVSNLGIEGYLWTSPAPGRIPLHRYYLSHGNDHHVLSADPGVIALFATFTSDYYTDEGIVGYVDAAPSSDANAPNQALYEFKGSRCHKGSRCQVLQRKPVSGLGRKPVSGLGRKPVSEGSRCQVLHCNIKTTPLNPPLKFPHAVPQPPHRLRLQENLWL